MSSDISGAAGFYFAIVMLANLFTLWFADPRKGTRDKILFWVVIPVVDIACMSMVFKSLTGGLAVGAMLMVGFFLIYLRYRD